MHHAIVIFALTILASPAFALPGACQRPTTIPPFSLDKPTLQRQATFINLWWTAGRPKEMSFDEAIAIRNKDIDSVYLRIETERRAAYSNAACLVVDQKKCASTAGNYHECPMQISPPTNMQFDGRTIKAIGTDFPHHGHPKLLADGTISYTVKKTGKGANVGGFQATAFYAKSYVDQQVKAEINQVRAFFEPLVTVDLQAKTGQ